MRPIRWTWPLTYGGLGEDQVALRLEDEDHGPIGQFEASFRDGRVHEVRLSTVDPLTSSDLHRFPWKRLVRLAAAQHEAGPGAAALAASLEVHDLEGNPVTWEAPRIGTTSELAAALADVVGADLPEAARARRPGRRGHLPGHYPSVAALYRKAAADITEHRTPAQVIAETFFVNQSTARGWIKKCRDDGLLPRRGERGT